MRWIFLSLGLMGFAATAWAQEQENKLIDRLLRPNMSLSNSAQDKKFNTVDGTPIDKKSDAKSFYSGDHATTKSFTGGKRFSSKKFRGNKSFPNDAGAYVSADRIVPNINSTLAIKSSSLVRPAAAAKKTVYARDYPDNRPFLAKGTRQKALSQQDKPLTIAEVRELLNKNN
jgi:hypothetical protein